MKYWKEKVKCLFESNYTMRMKYENITCKFCDSPNIVKNGTRRGTQYWLCKNCGKGFVANEALPKMKYPMEAIASAIYQYYAGLSLNDIRGYIDQQYKTKPSDSAIYNWVTRFSKVAVNEAKKHTPKVGNTWIADETVLRIGGKKYWLIDIIDSDTRFLLTTKLSHNRNKQDIKELMELARNKTGKTPKEILTDGWAGYLDGIELAYGADSKHVRTTPFGNRADSTTLIERWHGTLKDRTKVMRGMKSKDTAEAILAGWLVYYNYFRPHESLNDKTPAEVAKIKFSYKNWLDVVKKQSPVEQEKEKPTVISNDHNILFPYSKPYRKRLKPKIRKHTRRAELLLKGVRQ